MSYAVSRRSFATVALAGLFAPTLAAAHSRLLPATVLVVASLPAGPAADPNYTNEDLGKIISHFKPDWVGLEIRPEDMTADAAYLQAWYPQDMLTLKAQYGDKAFGFDWIGDDLNGQPIPADWGTTSSIKTLEAQSDAAPELQVSDKLALSQQLDTIRAQQDALLAKTNPRGLNDGRYDALCVKYYDTLKQLYAGTRFADLSTFYTARDAHIAANIAAFIKAHPGERIAIVTGADHHGAVTRYILETMHDVKLRHVTQT